MKICFVDNFSETDPEELIVALRDLGHTVTKECDETYDIIYCSSIFKMAETRQLKARYQHLKVVNYCWDFYKWAWEGKHDLPWQSYAPFLRDSDLVIVPSEGQQLRLKEMLDIDSVVVKTAIPMYEHEVTDERFVLDPMRYYPEENEKWAVQACEELGIPIIHSEHQYTQEEFRKLVHSCTFMTSCYREASTGGLTLIEGLYNGKPSLTSNSPYQGAKDYLGQYGTYFQYDDYKDLKAKIKAMWEKPPVYDLKEVRQYTQQFTNRAMAQKLQEVLCKLI